MTRLILANRYFHPDESATSRMLTDLARHWGERHEVIVVCSRQELENPRAALPRHGRLGSVRIERLWSTTLGRAWLPGRALDYLTFLASIAAWLLLHARRGDVVVAKTDPPMLGAVAALAARLRGARLVNWLQDLYPETAWQLGVGSAASRLGRSLRAIRNASLRAAALNVAISPGMADLVGAVGGVARPRVIPNWSEDLGGGARGSMRAELRLEQRFVLGYSGNLGRAHPIEPLLDIARRFAGRPGFHVLISGGGANMTVLRERVTALAPGNWTFLPYQPVERLGTLLATADVHVVLLDPRVERLIFPSKVYGILAAGRPILHLGDPDGEVAQLIRRHRCGWSLAASDGEAVEALLSRLLADPAEVQAAALAARAAFEQAYSRAQAMTRWDEALDTLRGGPGGEAGVDLQDRRSPAGRGS